MKRKKLNILYLGNALSGYGRTPTTIERLGKLLQKKYDVKTFSSAKLKLLRFFDCLLAIVWHRRTSDLILIDTYSTQYFWLAYFSGLLACWLHIPYIPILHGGALPHRFSKSERQVTQFLNGAAAIVSPSNYLKSYFDSQGFQGQTIPNFIDIRLYPYLERKKIQPKLLYVRSLHRKYNPKLAVSVLSVLIMKYPDAELCMVGPDKDGSLEECKRFAGELGVMENITFTGILGLKEWTDLAQQYDIFINTTNVDNTPVSVIEAMALGIPIVSTNVDGIPFLLDHGDNALLVPPNDETEFANAVFQLLEYPEKALQLATKARTKAESFRKETVLSNWEELVEDTLK